MIFIFFGVMLIIAWLLDAKNRYKYMSSYFELISKKYNDISNSQKDVMFFDLKNFLGLHGIKGEFNLPNDFNYKEWFVSGNMITVCRGHVLNKNVVTMDQIINNIATAKQKGIDRLALTDSDIRDHYNIEILTEHDESIHFYESQSAYEILNSGDEVYISFYQGKIQTIGYKGSIENDGQ